MTFKTMLAAAVAVGALAAAGAANATVILQDDFNGPTLGSDGAVGGGFSRAPGVTASVSGGLAHVGGACCLLDQNIYSNNTYNPIDTTLTWTVASRPFYGAAGSMVGFDQGGEYACAGCGPEIWLEARHDRTVFDVVDNNGLWRYSSMGGIGGFGEITMSLTMDATGWAWTISDTGATQSDSGVWQAGFAPADVMTAAGGRLATFGSVRSDCPYCGDGGSFDSVTLTGNRGYGVPEPASWSLMIAGFGLLGASLRRRTMAAA
jgi:hypothetical protein